jgi:hypothetical protein
LRDGKIKKLPCQVCVSESHVHAHHTDYSKPLEVVWLCAKCHHRIHACFPHLGGHYLVPMMGWLLTAMVLAAAAMQPGIG